MLTVHIVALIFSFGVMSVADKDALAWMRGKQQVLGIRRLKFLHALIWVGLITMIVSGFFLALPTLGFLLAQPLFLIKMLFVGILIANGLLIGRLSDTACVRPFATLSHHDRWRLFTSAAISMISWVGAALVALVYFK